MEGAGGSGGGEGDYDMRVRLACTVELMSSVFMARFIFLPVDQKVSDSEKLLFGQDLDFGRELSNFLDDNFGLPCVFGESNLENVSVGVLHLSRRLACERP